MSYIFFKRKLQLNCVPASRKTLKCWIIFLVYFIKEFLDSYQLLYHNMLSTLWKIINFDNENFRVLVCLNTQPLEKCCNHFFILKEINISFFNIKMRKIMIKNPSIPEWIKFWKSWSGGGYVLKRVDLSSTLLEKCLLNQFNQQTLKINWFIFKLVVYWMMTKFK